MHQARSDAGGAPRLMLREAVDSIILLSYKLRKLSVPQMLLEIYENTSPLIPLSLWETLRMRKLTVYF